MLSVHDILPFCFFILLFWIMIRMVNAAATATVLFHRIVNLVIRRLAIIAAAKYVPTAENELAWTAV